jgi:hypothetical protein
MTTNRKSYDRDGKGREELAKFKKDFFADFPTTKEWNSIKKSIEYIPQKLGCRWFRLASYDLFSAQPIQVRR